jgi:hypothetical protein
MIATIPRIIATPPRYGIGSWCDLCAAFGLSTKLIFKAILRITGVSTLTKAKVETNRIEYCDVVIITI